MRASEARPIMYKAWRPLTCGSIKQLSKFGLKGLDSVQIYRKDDAYVSHFNLLFHKNNDRSGKY